MLKVNLTARPIGLEEVLFTTQLTAEEIEASPIVPGGTIINGDTEYFIDEVGLTGGAQDGDDWVAEVRITVYT